MKQKSLQDQEEKFLSKTQEVLYQREFKKADKVYNQITQRTKA